MRRVATALPPASVCLAACAAAWILGAPAPARAQSPQHPRLLILSDGGPGWPATDLVQAHVRSALRTRYPDEAAIRTHYLDGSSFAEPSARAALRSYLEAVLRDAPDVIVTIGPLSFEFMAGEPTLFPEVPVVFAGDPGSAGYHGMAGPRFTGVSDSLDLAASLDLALELQPETERVYVVAGAAPFDSSYVERARRDLDRLRDRLEVHYLTGLPMDTLEARLARLPPRSVVLNLTLTGDGTGLLLTPPEGRTRVVRASNRPVYTWIESQMGAGIVAARAFDLERVAQTTAAIVASVLDGTPPAQVPPVLLPPDRTTVDWAAIRRWQIDPSRIPPDAIIINTAPTAWERYRLPLLIALAVILLEAALIGGLLLNRARRLSAERLAREKDEELRASYAQIRDLARRLIAAQDLERTALARELHEDVNQQLAGLGMRLSALHRSIPSGEVELHREIEWLQHRADLLVDAIRELSHGLHPVVIKHTGLPAVLRRIGDLVHRQHGVLVRVTGTGDFHTVPEPVALTFYRVAQEALENVVRHASASRVDINLTRANDNLTMQVRDDGRGFVSQNAVGLGLAGMRERLAVVGGDLEIDAEPGDGTCVEARIVLRPPYAPVLAASD